MRVPLWAGSSQPVGPLTAASLGEEPSNKLALTLNSHLAAASSESSSASARSQGPFMSSGERERKEITLIKGDSFSFVCSSEEDQRIGFLIPQRPTAVLVNADLHKLFRFSQRSFTWKREFCTPFFSSARAFRESLKSQVLLSSLTAPEHLNASQFCLDVLMQPNGV